ncbi:hypothetical protein D051_0891 [Vibrio parahaemolyticus VPCR-2010]|uniref:hypothetical protein n=1 Tax=Vibrio parahaemolyticus TaxID=670 RepID=UPI00038E7431|nr:hypothetical protein D051_0891 [Vibrio parahaemolyticus VPCR-2010]
MNKLNKIVIAKYLIDNCADHPFIADIYQSHGLKTLSESVRNSRNFLLAVTAKIGCNPDSSTVNTLCTNNLALKLTESYLEGKYEVAHIIENIVFVSNPENDLVVISSNGAETLDGALNKTDIEQLVCKYNILNSSQGVLLKVLGYIDKDIDTIVHNFDKLTEGDKLSHRLYSAPIEVKDTSRNGTGTYLVPQSVLASGTQSGNVFLFNPEKSFAVLVEGDANNLYTHTIAESFAIDAA